MELSLKGLNNRKEWDVLGYKLPQFDEKKVKENTLANPEWIHFGAGNIFRAFQANVVQTLLNEGVLDKGVIVAEGYDYEIIDKTYTAYDNYGILVTLKADGAIEKTVVGSVTEALVVDSARATDFKRLIEIFKAPSLKMISFTITEKGYSLVDSNGNLLEVVKRDIENGPSQAQSYMGKVVALLYERFLAAQLPIAMVSMDNCSHNGEKLYQAVYQIAKGWAEHGLVEDEFVTYIDQPDKVAFPWTMIDKITPRPDESVEQILKADEIENISPFVTSSHTYIAPFVNAEEIEYLVIEDGFPNGRVELEAGGIIYTTREIVEQVERMKVCTCLNPLHTALAIFGCLLGNTLISEEMRDPWLKRLVEQIGYKEGLPVVTDPKIISPEQFIKEVLEVRMTNPFIPDSPQRIATDTSQKLGIRFGETLKAYSKVAPQEIKNLKGITLVLAGWLRYLIGVDDMGENMPLSADPMLDLLCSIMEKIRLGESNKVHEIIEPILRMKNIFGVDLYEIGLGEQVEDYFSQMIQGAGRVRKTLETVLAEER